jgi:protein involved in polysaccharide export with SLBB domain
MTGRVPRYLCALFPLGLMVASALGAMQAPQEPASKPKQETPVPTKPEQPYDPTIFLEGLKPLPLEPIPDDPPPHEGAMFELSYRIESPDLVLVEVLEALPGRAITGPRLVRPDGTISLQWYGEVHVAGLTIDQAKVKIILHLRQFLTDEALGLIRWDPTGTGKVITSLKQGLQSPLRPLDPLPQFLPPPDFTESVPLPPPVPPAPAPSADPFEVPSLLGPIKQPTTAPSVTYQGVEGGGDRISEESVALQKRLQTDEGGPTELTQPAPFPLAGFGDSRKSRHLTAPGQAQGTVRVGANHAAFSTRTPGGDYFHAPPAASDRIFVDVSAYNSTVYYVQCDGGAPGRITWTGKETVLDAINYAGGLLPSADDSSIHLYRPARGKQAAREYSINYRAILRGDQKANLQMFFGDRLVVPRKDPNLMLGARGVR